MSQLNPSEISSVLKEKIAGLDLSAERKNEGIVVSVSDGIVRIHGMGDVMYGEVIEFENGTKGMALNLEQDSVGAVVLGDYLEIIEGQKAVCTGKVLEVPVGEGLTPLQQAPLIPCQYKQLFVLQLFQGSLPRQQHQQSLAQG